MVEHTTPVYSGSAETDIVVVGASFMVSTYGLIGGVFCNDAVSTTRCDQQYVYLDIPWYDSQTYNPYRKGNACHELGHAIGLTHGSNAAPIGAGSQPTDSWESLKCLGIPSSTYPVLGSHNKEQINGQW